MEKVIKGGSLENTIDEIAKEIIKRDKTVSDESIAAVGALQEEVSSVKSAINVLESSKADAIIGESSSKNTFSASELDGYGNDYKIVCNATGYSTVMTAKAEDICPLTDANITGVIAKSAGVNKSTATGTPETASVQYMKVGNVAKITPKQAISQGDTIQFGVYADGAMTAVSDGTTPGRFEFYLYYTDNTSKETRVEFGLSGGEFTNSVTAEKDVSSIGVTLRCRDGYTFNTEFSWSIVKSVSYSSVNVPSGNMLVFSKTDVGSNGFSIIPPTAKVNWNISIEDYVSSHIPEGMLTKDDLVYLSPEMYGAKGDGITNDATAIQTCINAATTANVPVRAYGNYKIGQGIDIVGSYLDIYIHKLELSAGTYAVKITGRNNHFRSEYINSYGVTGASGLKLETSASGDDCSYNEIDIGLIYAYTNSIEINNQYSKSNDKKAYYNRIAVNTISARNGNCFHLNGDGEINENSFWAKRAICYNGYAVYNVDWSNESNKFYEICLESSSKNGVYGYATLVNCRTTELMDTIRPGGADGVIFRFDGCMPYGKVVNGVVDYLSVDVENALSVDDVKAIIKNNLENGASKAAAYDLVLRASSISYVVGNALRLWSFQSASDGWGQRTPTGRVIAYYNHKGYVPDIPWEHEIDVSDYTPIVTDANVPTIFNIKTNTTIHLEDSYCCVGINDFAVVQANGYKAVVYDKGNNLIFDGTNQTDGTYRFRCTMTPYSFTITTDGGAEYEYDVNWNKGKYFITNERWTVEKLNVL
jgi:hypothetical protein